MSGQDPEAAPPTGGRVSLVTGAGSGIGEATALRLAANGGRVVVVDLDGAAAQRVVDAVTDRSGPGRALAVRADVTSRDDVQAAVDAAVTTFGRLDILVTCAGVLRDGMFHKMTDDDWSVVLRTHLDGTFRCAQIAQRHMVAQRWGRIVVMSSRSALGNRGQANYAAAKAGLQGFARTLAIELGRFGVTVNAVAPGFIATPMTRSITERTGASWDEVVAAAAGRTSVGRVGRPEEIAALIAFLVGEESGFITGQTIYATGSPTG